MGKYTDEQLRRYAADIIAGLKNVQLSPEDVAGVMAWGLGIIFNETGNKLTKDQYLANVVTTVDLCIQNKGEAPRILRPV